MSAEILRRAAALMRERAEAATPGPWECYGDHLVWPNETGPAANDPILAIAGEAHNDTAEHIASWHPAVALAVADLLDHTAEADEQHQLQIGRGIASGRMTAALALARAYLGDPS